MNSIAKSLLDSKAVHIQPIEENFFTWTSGKRSPIYCDNRQLISYPGYRNQIIKEFTKLIKEQYPQVELIAGTATAGIPWAAWISHELNLPLIYIRSKPKGHGLKSAIEGHITKNQKTIIIEDLISTGKSAIEAVAHAKADSLDVLSVLSIFTYGFKEADSNFKNAKIVKSSLCTLESLLTYSQENQLLSSSDVETVNNWKNNFR
ncbi:MAG: orotate phosphoribosyltransferase [Halobacteriovoraceae bacterium]|jgi:orotate phosphoribosyltransferase|nr:orotate phosphoribosyltransferase [Halobacteriovoraceae bacterium]